MNRYFVYILILISSCSSETRDSSTEMPQQENTLTITDQQRKQFGIVTGSLDFAEFPTVIQVGGKLDVPPQSLIDISSPLGGIVQSTHLLQGMRVRKGETLVVLKHPDFIQWQQDYLKAENTLDQLKLEFDRQTQLAKDSVNSRKSLEKVTAEYRNAQAEVQGLAARLELMQLKPQDVRTKGITSTITLTSPTDAYVSEVFINIGKPVNSNDVLVRLVDTDHLHVELQVFEKDVLQIAKGQRIRFKVIGDTLTRLASVYLVGHDITADRTIRVHGHLDNDKTELLPGMYVQASIEANPRKLLQIPQQAIVSHEGHTSVFVESKPGFMELVPVEVLQTYQENAGIASREFPGPVVLTGSYTLLAVLTNSELE